MGYNHEGSKLRQAAIAIIAPLVAALTFADHDDPTAVNCYDAQRARRKRTAGVTSVQSKELPCISFRTLDGAEIIAGTGNKRVPLVVRVESHADCDEEIDDDDPESNHELMCSTAFDAINDEAIASSLSTAVPDFHVYEVYDMGELEVEAEDGRFITEHRWDVVCANQALS